jgi:serine/threonine-protein kinase
MDRLVAAKYMLRTEVGRGPHGVVWRARHLGPGEECAVKVLHEHYATDVIVVDRFVQAEGVLRAYLHPAYVRVRELVVDREQLALVTEFVAGVDLRRYLATIGPPTARLAASIVAAAAEAIAASHAAGVVHGNIKPTNVLLPGEIGRVRITDCRIARLARGLGDVGDDAYAAPEVRAGRAPVRATDVYGLGLILYETLTGTRGSGPEPDLPKSIDRRLRETLEQCLAANPDERMSAAELGTAMRQFDRLPRPATAPQHRPVIEHPGADDGPPRPRVPSRELVHVRRGASGRAFSRWRLALLSFAGGATVVAVAALIVSVPKLSNSGRVDSLPPQAGATTAIEPRSSAAGTLGVPVSAAADSTAGATAFVSYWFDALNHAVQTGDDTALRAASSPACQACTAAATSIDTGHQDGRSLQGGTYTVRSVQVDSFFDLNRPRLRVVYDRTTRSTIDVDQQIIATQPGTTFAICQIVLERPGAQWRVLDVQASAPVA